MGGEKIKSDDDDDLGSFEFGTEQGNAIVEEHFNQNDTYLHDRLMSSASP